MHLNVGFGYKSSVKSFVELGMFKRNPLAIVGLFPLTLPAAMAVVLPNYLFFVRANVLFIIVRFHKIYFRFDEWQNKRDKKAKKPH